VNDVVVHLALFAAIGIGIVTLASFYAEPDDAKALPTLPRRFAMFALGCGVLAVLLVVAQHTVASVR
jgi:hypothetical protein